MRKVAIIGGGPSAVAVFLQLVKRKAATEIVIFDVNPVGFGFGFNSHSASHLCNTSACVNSIDADDEHDFLNYLRSSGWSVNAEAFVPRYVVAQYCRERFLRYAKCGNEQGVRTTHTPMIVEGVRPHKTIRQLEIRTSEGSHIVDAAVICVGARGKADFSRMQTDGFSFDPAISTARPYPAEQLLQYARDKQHIAIIGSKLSAIDAAISLCEAGKNVTMVSRSGHFPSVRTRLAKLPRNPFFRSGEPPRRAFDFIHEINSVLKANMAKASKASGHAARTLNFDILSAERGKNIWQEYVADIIDSANKYLSEAPARTREKIKFRTKHLISRYISSIPLSNAKKLQQFCEKGMLRIIVGNAHQFRRQGEKICFGPMDSPHYCDGLVMADGTINPAIRREHGELRVSFASLPEFHETLSIEELNSAGIWLSGGLSVSKFPIVNYLKFSVDNAKSIVDDLIRKS